MTDKIGALRVHLTGIGLAGLMLAVPFAATSDPSDKSVAGEIQACRPEGTQTAQVCSTKELSNVVVQCVRGEGESFFVKYDDLDGLEIPHQGVDFSLASPYVGDFSCPEGSALVAIFVKSGSQKYDGPAIAGLPKGSGAVWSFGACPVACPVPVDEGEETPPPPPPPTDGGLN